MSTPTSQNPQGFLEENDDRDFVFNFNGQVLKSPPLSAAELFDGGKIKPLKLMSRTQYRGNDSPVTPRSPKRMITKAFIVSPRLIATNQDHHSSARHTGQKQSKCLSTTLTGLPNVVSELTKTRQTSVEIASLSSVSFSRSISSASSTSSSNWSSRLKFLFRSASEGHAIENEDDSWFKRKSHMEDSKSMSFRSENGRHLVTKDGRRPNERRVCAHAWHYKKSKEAAEERRRKTFLPYKKNLLGCMDLDPGSVSEVSRWVGVEITC